MSKVDRLLAILVAEMGLTVQRVPHKSPYDFAAHRLDNKGWFLVEYAGKKSLNEINELLEWESPKPVVRDLLAGCESHILLHYHDTRQVRKAISIIYHFLGDLSAFCILENGFGCLIPMPQFNTQMSNDEDWTWKRYSFPELPDVADSEWVDDE